MKLLFLVFRGFSEYNGISKKMRYQIEAFIANGVDTQLCYTTMDEDGTSKRVVDECVLENFGKGFFSKLKKRFSYTSLINYIRDNDIRNIYIRYEHNASPFFISALKKLKKMGVKIVLEIPTYPYDSEYRKQGFKLNMHLLVDKCFRNSLAKHIDYIVTFSDDDEIFGVPTIKISNGISFDAVPLKKDLPHDKNRLNLIGVAEIHLWHGFDRLIQGLAEYYKKPHDIEVYFDVVGYGAPDYLKKLELLVIDNHLEKYVIFHGPQYGEALDALFDNADLGVASLARHRSNIFNIKTLKNREYAARGIPFIYSEIDDDFEQMPYIHKINPDESPVVIEDIIDFYSQLSITSEEIRNSITHLSWTEQMKKVLIQSFS